MFNNSYSQLLNSINQQQNENQFIGNNQFINIPNNIVSKYIFNHSF
jgi:hypothetical protein